MAQVGQQVGQPSAMEGGVPTMHQVEAMQTQGGAPNMQNEEAVIPDMEDQAMQQDEAAMQDMEGGAQAMQQEEATGGLQLMASWQPSMRHCKSWVGTSIRLSPSAGNGFER